MAGEEGRGERERRLEGRLRTGFWGSLRLTGPAPHLSHRSQFVWHPDNKRNSRVAYSEEQAG